MTYQPMNLPDVTKHINELHKILDIYPSSSLLLELDYYEKLKNNIYEKR
jgi:hypothetical protein